MEGHLGTDFIMKPWIRRVITRLLAIVPAMFTAISGGDAAIYNLLLFSQVILSLQLPFAVWPLIYFTSSPRIMESKHLLGNETPVRSNCNWVMTVIGVLIATFLTVLNFILLVQVANGT